MADDVNYTDLNVSEIDDSEQFTVCEPLNVIKIDSNLNTFPNDSDHTQDLNSEEHFNQEKSSAIVANRSEALRITRLPMTRIKNIMKMDPDVNVLSNDAVFLVSKATELFLETIIKETYSYTLTNKRKVISKKDLDLTINKVDCLCFLEGAMDF
ncbi:hypothetical protein ACJJTC_008900 [Scirpophaga incertulas]